MCKPDTVNLELEDQRQFVFYLVQMILSEKQPGMVSFLNGLLIIIRNNQDILSDYLLKLILAALAKLAREFINKENGIAYEVKVEIRSLAAELAFEIFQFLNEKGITTQQNALPQEIEHWKEICVNPEEFAEVRNKWRPLLPIE